LQVVGTTEDANQESDMRMNIPCIKKARTTFLPRCNLSSVWELLMFFDSMAVVDVIGYSPPTPIP
jgi:hypothetical protein